MKISNEWNPNHLWILIIVVCVNLLPNECIQNRWTWLPSWNETWLWLKWQCMDRLTERKHNQNAANSSRKEFIFLWVIHLFIHAIIDSQHTHTHTHGQEAIPFEYNRQNQRTHSIFLMFHLFLFFFLFENKSSSSKTGKNETWLRQMFCSWVHVYGVFRSACAVCIARKFFWVDHFWYCFSLVLILVLSSWHSVYVSAVVWGKTFEHIIIIGCVYVLSVDSDANISPCIASAVCMSFGEWAGRREWIQWKAWNRVASQMDSFDILVFVRRLFYYLSPLFLLLPLDVYAVVLYTLSVHSHSSATQAARVWLRISLTETQNSSRNNNRKYRKKKHEKFSCLD